MNGIIDKLAALFAEAKENATVIYAEKGWEPFKKPVLFAAPVILVLYAAVYSPTTARLQARVAEHERLAMIHSYSADFEDAKLRQAALQRKLPALKDKEEWLNYLLSTTARAHNITFDSLSAQNETEVGGVLVVSRDVTLTTTYATLGGWLAEIENSPIFLRITTLDIRKDNAKFGHIKVSFRIATVFSKLGGGAK